MESGTCRPSLRAPSKSRQNHPVVDLVDEVPMHYDGDEYLDHLDAFRVRTLRMTSYAPAISKITLVKFSKAASGYADCPIYKPWLVSLDFIDLFIAQCGQTVRSDHTSVRSISPPYLRGHRLVSSPLRTCRSGTSLIKDRSFDGLGAMAFKDLHNLAEHLSPVGPSVRDVVPRALGGLRITFPPPPPPGLWLPSDFNFLTKSPCTLNFSWISADISFMEPSL